MNKKSISDVLLSLASNGKKRSETARLRDIFDSVEAALSAGVSRADIVEALHGEGFSMGINSFDSAMSRIRRRNKKAQQSGSKAPPGQPPAKQEIAPPKAKPEPIIEDENPPVASHNPDDITKIMSAPVDLDALSKHAKRKK
jgi:hypothetical protein